MYYWHWLGGHDRWYDWSLVATTSRTINHDCSYLSSSPIVRNRTLARTTNICERLQMEIVWSITVWSCNQSEQLVTGRTTDRATAGHQNHERLVVRPRTNGGTITRDWWYDHVRHVCVLWSQTDRREFWTWPSTDFARTITYNHPQPLRSVARSLYDLTAISKFFDRNQVAGLVWLWQS